MNIQEKRSIDSVLLSVLRTELANRRTLLAYCKLAIGIIISAIGLIKFSDQGSTGSMIGFLLLPLAGVILLVGIWDYFRTVKVIQRERKDADV